MNAGIAKKLFSKGKEAAAGCRSVPGSRSSFFSLLYYSNFIIQYYGRLSKDEIIRAMRNEEAYTEIASHDLIQFKYARTLSAFHSLV